jgi:hypothetical protein
VPSAEAQANSAGGGFGYDVAEGQVTSLEDSAIFERGLLDPLLRRQFRGEFLDAVERAVERGRGGVGFEAGQGAERVSGRAGGLAGGAAGLSPGWPRSAGERGTSSAPPLAAVIAWRLCICSPAVPCSAPR